MSTASETAEGAPLRCEVIARPAELTAERATELSQHLVRLSALATSQGDPSYRPAVDGWTRYYSTPGDRPGDYDRLSLVYARDELVSLAALKLLETRGEPRLDVIWLQLILTTPQYRRTTATTRALAHLLLDPTFQAGLRRGYLVARTPNPLVYEATLRLRGWCNSRGSLEFHPVLPEILEGGRLAPIPDDHRAHLNEIVGMISDPKKFQPDTFVARGYYAALGPLYKNYDFQCKSAVVREYFARHVRWETQDGILFAVPFSARAKLGQA